MNVVCMKLCKRAGFVLSAVVCFACYKAIFKEKQIEYDSKQRHESKNSVKRKLACVVVESILETYSENSQMSFAFASGSSNHMQRRALARTHRAKHCVEAPQIRAVNPWLRCFIGVKLQHWMLAPTRCICYRLDTGARIGVDRRRPNVSAAYVVLRHLRNTCQDQRNWHNVTCYYGRQIQVLMCSCIRFWHVMMCLHVMFCLLNSCWAWSIRRGKKPL